MVEKVEGKGKGDNVLRIVLQFQISRRAARMRRKGKARKLIGICDDGSDGNFDGYLL